MAREFTFCSTQLKKNPAKYLQFKLGNLKKYNDKTRIFQFKFIL